MGILRAGIASASVLVMLAAVGCASGGDSVGGSGGAATTGPTSDTETTASGPVAAPVTTDAPAGDDADTTVSRVIDGDTIVVASGERVRFIGMDTPETVDPRKSVQCFGREASARTASLIPAGTALRLVYDVERHDRYGRTLAYVYRADDGLFVNAALVRDGYALVATYPPNVAHADEFTALQREAREANRGLWSACNEEAPADATVSRVSATPTPSPTTAAVTPPASNCDAAYPDVCIPSPPPDLNCADVPHHDIRVVQHPDPHGFDRDRDGVGCES